MVEISLDRTRALEFTRGYAIVDENPLISSPAMPTTTWPGTVLAMSSAASSARFQDWITDSRSATSRRRTWRQGPAVRAHSEHLAVGPLSPTTRTLIRSVPMSSTVKWR